MFLVVGHAWEAHLTEETAEFDSKAIKNKNIGHIICAKAQNDVSNFYLVVILQTMRF